jgi:hypothetical protein
MRAAAGLSGGSQVRSNSEGESKFTGGAALDTNQVPELAVGNASRPFKRRRGFDEPMVRYHRGMHTPKNSSTPGEESVALATGP